MATPIPSFDDNAPSLIEAFSCILGNNCKLVRVLRRGAWNGAGAGALEACRLFNMQARELFDAQDDLAMRIVALGGFAEPDEREDVVVDGVDGGGPMMCSALHFAVRLARGHGDALISIEAAADVAEECRDRVSLDILIRRLAAHQRHRRDLARLAEAF